MPKLSNPVFRVIRRLGSLAETRRLEAAGTSEKSRADLSEQEKASIKAAFLQGVDTGMLNTRPRGKRADAVLARAIDNSKSVRQINMTPGVARIVEIKATGNVPVTKLDGLQVRDKTAQLPRPQLDSRSRDDYSR